MNLLILIIATFPQLVFAAEKPSMDFLWLELGFMLLMLIILKVASFSNQVKLILFGAYILSGILTQSIWFPVLLFIGLYIYFKETDG